PPDPALARELGHAWRGGARRRRLRCARERRAAEERAAAGEPAEMRFRLAERGLVSEPPGNRRVGPSGLLADEGEVAVILDFLSLDLVEELVNLADVGMPEGPDPAVEALQELVAVCFTFAEQRQQRVPQVHVPPSLRQLGSEPRARSRSARILRARRAPVSRG